MVLYHLPFRYPITDGFQRGTGSPTSGFRSAHARKRFLDLRRRGQLNLCEKHFSLSLISFHGQTKNRQLEDKAKRNKKGKGILRNVFRAVH